MGSINSLRHGDYKSEGEDWTGSEGAGLQIKAHHKGTKLLTCLAECLRYEGWMKGYEGLAQPFIGLSF